MRPNSTQCKLLICVLPILWLLDGQLQSLRANNQTAEPAAPAASCSQFMAPKKNVNGKMVGQEECLMQDHGIVEPNRKYHRVDMGISGTLAGYIVKEGARQNYFTSGPDFTFTQYGNPHSPRFNEIGRAGPERQQ